MQDSRCFVQFIHPGGEHSAESDEKAWNTGDHMRKFMKARGAYVTEDGRREGDIVFWGEWEPESHLLKRYARHSAGMPEFLWEPYFVRPTSPEWRQNTDPFVFGGAFQYTGCKQQTKRGPTRLRYLSPGSLVLFGSCLGKSQFVIDTVFVVDSHTDHDPSNYQAVLKGEITDTYRTVTIDPWYSWPHAPGRSFRLYRGATVDRPVGKMYSFFPCQLYEHTRAGFARPTIELPGLVTPQLMMGQKIAQDVEPTQLEETWDEVVRQVGAQGLALGVYAELPPQRT